MSGSKTEYMLSSLGNASKLSPEDLERVLHPARVIVARNAHDDEDCSELLDMLGIGKVVEI